MNRHQRRLRNKRTKEANNLQWNSLDAIDKITISVAVIKQRDWLFDCAEEYLSKNNPKRAQQQEHLAAKYNSILLKLGHPAAIQIHILQLPKPMKVSRPISEEELVKNTNDVLDIVEESEKCV